MGRTKGPVKGSVAFVCEENATSSMYIAEALMLTQEQWEIMEAGGTFTGEVIKDNATQTRYVSLTNGEAKETVIESAFIGLGDGTTKTFTKTFVGTQAKPTTAVVTAGAITGTTDIKGIITGTGIIGVIVNEASKVTITVTFTNAPADDVPVLAAYNGSIDECAVGPIFVGVGDGTDPTFSATLTAVPVQYEGFTVTTSDGIVGVANASTGAITGAGITSGSITHAGVLTLVFAVNIPDGSTIVASYIRNKA